ncbi:MAG: alpha/beta hydrolase [Burkholderiaceae bacterium]
MHTTPSSFRSTADGTEIFTYAWADVAGQPIGVVQIAHGLAEHGERYARFAKALNAAGFLAYAVDHRGHGRSAQGRLGDFGAAGFDGLIADVAQFGSALRARHDGLPLFLFGHSMGSFAAQAAVLDHASTWSGVVLSGSTALDALAEGMAEAPAGLEAFNAGFEHRTGYEWLSRDEAEVDAYVADPWCGWEIPDGLIPSLLAPAPRLADPALLAGIRRDLPVLIASGDADPLAAGGPLVQLLGQRYREAGIADVTVMLYPAARHEILNETNRDAITADIVAWLRAHVA